MFVIIDCFDININEPFNIDNNPCQSIPTSRKKCVVNIDWSIPIDQFYQLISIDFVIINFHQLNTSGDIKSIGRIPIHVDRIQLAPFYWTGKFTWAGPCPKKKILAPALLQKKNSCTIKLPNSPPPQKSNGPSLNMVRLTKV